MKRPLGITLLCVLNGFGEGLALLGSFAIRGPLGLLIAVTAIIGFVAVYGLWTLKAWGWALIGLLYAVGIILELIRLIAGAGTSWSLPTVIAGSSILLYLYRKRDLYLSEEPPTKRKDKKRGSYRNP
jgi:hypothetical protein